MKKLDEVLGFLSGQESSRASSHLHTMHSLPGASHSRFYRLRRPHDPSDRHKMHTDVLSTLLVALLAGLISC